MKKNLAILLLIILNSSCKKSYTCFCSQDNFPDKTVVIRDTKKKAKIKCNNETTIFDNSYPPEPIVIGHYNCILK